MLPFAGILFQIAFSPHYLKKLRSEIGTCTRCDRVKLGIIGDYGLKFYCLIFDSQHNDFKKLLHIVLQKYWNSTVWTFRFQDPKTVAKFDFVA